MKIKLYHPDKSTLSEAGYDEYKRGGTAYDVVNNDDGTITIKAKIRFKKELMDFEYVLDVAANKGKAIELDVHESTEKVIIEGVYVYERADRIQFPTDGRSSVKVAVIVVDDNCDVYIMLSQCYDNVDGFENVSMDKTHTPRYYLAQSCEWFANVSKKLSTKSMFLRYVDPYDSISYLESQVDLLTKLVLSLAKDKGVEEEYLNLLGTADKYSVLNIKSTDAVEEEFTEKKAGFRERQEKYYGERPD